MSKDSDGQEFYFDLQGRKRLKMLHYQLIAFNLSGILQLEKYSQHRWKAILYGIFTWISLIWFIPSITLQLIKLYQCLDDIEVATQVLFQVSCYISTGVIFFYYVVKRSTLVKIFDTLEGGFIVHIDKVGSPIKRKAILDAAFKKARVLTLITLVLSFTVKFAWGVLPFLLGYFEYLAGYETKDKERYFGLAMWLPENVNKSPNFELMHICHFIMVYTVVSNITGCYMLMFAMAFHTTTLFKILCAAFEDVDYFVQNSESSVDNKPKREYDLTRRTHEDMESLYPEMWFGDDSYKITPGSITSFTGQITHRIKGEDNMGFINTSNDNVHVQNTEINTQEEYIPERISNTIKTPENSEHLARGLASTFESSDQPSDEQLKEYLLDCIKFHQQLIQFTTELNNFLSPVLLVFFLFSYAMMCFSTFQLAVSDIDERSFKFFNSVILASVWPLMVCLYGDDLTEQSIAVKNTAYSCRWFYYSASFNKILRTVMMRADYPIYLTAGPFYLVSLDTFSNIGNKVYAFYTLLKQMHER